MGGDPRYKFLGKSLIDRARRELTDREFHQLEVILKVLETGPRPGESNADITELKDPNYPGCFTVPFDDALLVYKVYADHPRIQLLTYIKI